MTQHIFDKAQNTFFRNAFAGFVRMNLNTALNLVTFAVLVRVLDLEVYGTVLLAGYLINQVQTFDGGVLQSLEKFVPHYAAEGDSSKIAAAVTLGLILLLGLSVLMSLTIVLFIETGWIFKLPHENGAQLVEAAWTAALLIPLAWIAQGFRHIVFGFLNHGHVYTIDLGVTVGALALTVGGAMLGADAQQLIVLRALPLMLATGGFYLSIRARYTGPLLTRDLQKVRTVAREAIGFTSWLLLIKGAAILKFIAERILPAALLGVGGVPIFDGLLRVVSFVVGLNNGFKQVAMPLASGLSKLDRGAELSQIATQGTNVMTALFAPILITLALFGGILLGMLGGKDFEGYSEGLAIELLILTLLIPRAFAQSLLLGEGSNIRYQAAWAVSSNAAYLLLAAVFMQLGGAELGIVAHGAAHLVFMPWLLIMLHKSGRFDVGNLLRSAARPLIPCWLIGLSAYLAMWLYPPPDSRILDAMFAILALAILYVASYLFGLTPEMRQKVQRKLLRRKSAA